MDIGLLPGGLPAAFIGARTERPLSAPALLLMYQLARSGRTADYDGAAALWCSRDGAPTPLSGFQPKAFMHKVSETREQQQEGMGPVPGSVAQDRWLDRTLPDLCLGCHGTHATPLNDAKRPLYAINNRLRERLVRAREAIAGAIQLVHGPADVNCARDEAVVLCLVRDGETWIDTFVRHYTRLGVKHIFFLDNGSRDNTIRRASRFDHVTVYRTDIGFKYFEVGLRRWFTRTLGQNRWALAPDADELWDYPYSDRLELGSFLQYLNHHSYKAVTAHALDMFSDLPFNKLSTRPADDLRQQYRFYDISDIVRTREVYWAKNGQLESDAVSCTFGGVRQRFFGTECLCQTRHALHFADRESDPYRYDGHFTAGARIADISTVLLHYKFVATLLKQAVANLALGQHHGGSENYRGFVEVLSAHPDLSLITEHARELHSVNDLVARGFLTVSAEYLSWVEKHGTIPL